MTILVMVSTALILWFGGQMVMAGQLTLAGELVAFNAYLLRSRACPTARFRGQSAGEAVAGGQRIFEVLDLPEEIASPRAAPAP